MITNIQKISVEELAVRLQNLKNSMGSAFIAGKVLEENGYPIVDITTNATISLGLFMAMNEIMEANQVIQVWTSGGKADQMKSYFRIQFVYY